MTVLNQYITFLKEYKKLLERGVKNVLNSNISSNFIWVNEINEFIDSGICSSILPDIFSPKATKQPLIFSLKKPYKPDIKIPKEFSTIIEFVEAHNKFVSINKDEDYLEKFKTSLNGKTELEKIKKFEKNKKAYSWLYRANSDIKNNSNIEIVLSVGLIQYSKHNRNGNLSKTNQHLFHFPLSLEIDSENVVNISFSSSENPYVDFFFLNNTPIEKDILSNLIDRFEQKISENGYEYIFEDDFKKLVTKSVQKISSNSSFESSIYMPEKDHYKEDHFKISYSPAINIKHRKPRFFEKLTDSIIKYGQENEIEAKLFNLIVRNPKANENNSYTKPNYFKDELFEVYKSRVEHLNAEEDFSVFFPLPFNKEQKQIYENYLKNRLTVVTGPPGTGKSHTIVNILCSLLAQGKKVLVTAQTDKALESLLDKIPETFDSLIFTKIQLETNQNRFSLEKSIGSLSRILTDDFFSNVESKIEELDTLKAEYVKLKTAIIKALEKEYQQIKINDSFNNLRAYQIVEKFEAKEKEEWNWIKDILLDDEFSNFEKIEKSIKEYQKLSDTKIRYSHSTSINISDTIEKLERFDFNEYLAIQTNYRDQLRHLNLNEHSKNKVLNIRLDDIINTIRGFSNSDIKIKNITDLKKIRNKINSHLSDEDLTANKTFSDLTENSTKYLMDIETYLSFSEKGKASLLTKYTNSRFKQVSYLEQFTVNGKRCNNRTEILKLKSLIENLIVIKNNFEILKQHGFSLSINNNSNLVEKQKTLEESLKKLSINEEIVSKIQHNTDFISMSEYSNVDLFDIDTLSSRSILYKEDFEKLRNTHTKLKELKRILRSVNSKIENSSIKNLFINFLPIQNLENANGFEGLKDVLFEIDGLIKKEQKFLSLKYFLEKSIPKTFDKLKTVSSLYVTKENFEFAAANEYLKKYRFTDLQKCTEDLSSINKKIFEVKCDILFDLAKVNFKNKFKSNEVDTFINLLESYKYNLSQSVRKIKNQTKFQILTRKNSIDISNKLSCWVMKFNDVLNSVGDEPEIFDCIIVDEASQLDFNSLILSYYTENMIIVGDDKQTSPSSLTGADGNDFEAIKNKYLNFLGTNTVHIKSDNSLFMLAKMVAGTSNLTLKEHFRCVPEIIEFSKYHFYDNSLRPLKQINSNRLPPKESVYVEGGYTEDKIVDKEIKEIKKFLQRILKELQYSNKSIGVVSLGSSKHTEKLKDIKEDLASEFGKELIDKHKLIIEDSPKFQGDERDVMIVSLGVAMDYQRLRENKNAKPRAIISSQDDFKRINVALSRAKEQMILFHSVKSEHLQLNDFRNKILNFFYEEINPIPPLKLDEYSIERNRHNVPEPFDSWFEYDIAKCLIENGFNYIQPQYNVREDEVIYNIKLGKNVYVNFKLDLVVHNNGKLIAIECDGDPFHSLPEDVAYDNERQEFLHRVGWKVHRILYSNFRRNPKEVIKEMINYIETNTKKDNPINIQKPIGKSNKIEIDDRRESIVSDKNLSGHKSYIDYLEENISSTIIKSTNSKENHQHKSLNSVNDTEIKELSKSDINTDKNKTLCYFILFENNKYRIQTKPEKICLFSIPIKEKYRNGFLLQCYDNGHINKIYVQTLLNKKIDKIYSNGKNPDANIHYLKLIKSDSIIGLKIKRNGDTIFKAHKTSKISNRELLHLKGFKVIYQDYDFVEYKILPNEISKDIERLTFESFNARGKSTHNKYYELEWNLIKQYVRGLVD